MRSKVGLQKWVDDALKDGWKKGPESRHKQAHATYFEMFKEGEKYRAFVWFGQKASLCSLRVSGPNGQHEAPFEGGQQNGYDFPALVAACIGCHRQDCRDQVAPLRAYGMNHFCEACIKDIEDYAKKNPITERKYIGTAKVEFRHVRGRVNTKKVKEYRVLCRIDSKEITASNEPYNGESKKMAYAASSTTFFTLSLAGYKVEQIEKHTTWNGEEIKNAK